MVKDGPKDPVVTIPVTIDFRKLTRKEDKLSSSCLKLSKRGEAIQEKFKEHASRKVNVPAIQRLAHDLLMEKIYDLWVRGEADFNKPFDVEPVEEHMRQVRDWEKFMDELPQLIRQIRIHWDDGMPHQAIDLAKKVQFTIKGYAADSSAGIRLMRGFYKKINTEVRKTLDPLPVSFGLNDFEDPGPDDAPFE